MGFHQDILGRHAGTVLKSRACSLLHGFSQHTLAPALYQALRFCTHSRHTMPRNYGNCCASGRATGQQIDEWLACNGAQAQTPITCITPSKKRQPAGFIPGTQIAEDLAAQLCCESTFVKSMAGACQATDVL